VKPFVELVTKALVEHPEAVDVRIVEDSPEKMTIAVQVAADDMGKIIGRGGRVIKAVRTLARAAATRTGKRITVEIVR